MQVAALQVWHSFRPSCVPPERAILTDIETGLCRQEIGVIASERGICGRIWRRISTEACVSQVALQLPLIGATVGQHVGGAFTRCPARSHVGAYRFGGVRVR